VKNLQPHIFEPNKCRREWNDYTALLASKPVLSERRDVLPFFTTREDLSLLICNYFPKIKTADRIAHEFGIYGDFTADLIVGDSSVHH
jgi:hypothetical protein